MNVLIFTRVAKHISKSRAGKTTWAMLSFLSQSLQHPCLQFSVDRGISCDSSKDSRQKPKQILYTRSTLPAGSSLCVGMRVLPTARPLS